MLSNYLAIALRNIRRNPLSTSINLFGLAVGIAACLIIYIFILDERSFDDFHSKKHSIYRLNEVQNFTGISVQKVALSSPGMGLALVTDFPEIKDFTRFWNQGKRLVEKDATKLIVDDTVQVDSSFLKIFDFELAVGDRSTALNKPFTVVLTAETALKLFRSSADALNSVLEINKKSYTVTGILKKIPENSHLKFNILISIASTTHDNKAFNMRWDSNFLNTYLVLRPGTDVTKLESKFPDFLTRHSGVKEITKAIALFLQPLKEIHLSSSEIEHDYNNYRKFNGRYLYVFTLIGFFILFIATVNFMNLTTARSSQRFKEVGIRSMIGAKKLDLVTQFLFESVLIAFFSLAIAILLNILLIPAVNNRLGRDLSLHHIQDIPTKIFWVISITSILGLLAGLYPSLQITSLKVPSLLKTGAKPNEKFILNNSLIIVQFGLALAMIVSTFTVQQQLSFIRNKDLGFNQDHIILVEMNQEANHKFETLKTELSRSSLLHGVTAAGQRLGNSFDQWGFKIRSDSGVHLLTPSNINVDYDYLNVYGIKLAKGRAFSKDIPRDNGYAFIINESFEKKLGLKETVGTPAGHGFYSDDSLGVIIGVVHDFNFNSLHHTVNALSLVVHPEWGYDEMSIKIDGANVEAAVREIKNIWDKNVSYPFTYLFLDQHIDNLYRYDKQMNVIVSIMTGLAILISCMGLFGLVTIRTESRVKEIGIRKTLGASVFQITVMLSRTFVTLILFSFVLITPITWWALSKWLQGFAYRVEISSITFLIGFSLTIVITLATTSYRIIGAARANPIKALRH